MLWLNNVVGRIWLRQVLKPVIERGGWGMKSPSLHRGAVFDGSTLLRGRRVVRGV